MDRINRSVEGVSPVIATILLVAITVVLAATLYSMLDTFSADESESPLIGNLSRRDIRTLSLGLTTPSSASLEDVTVSLLGTYHDGETIDLRFEDWDEENTAHDDKYEAVWYLLHNDKEIGSGSRLRFYRIEDGTLSNMNFDEFRDLEVIMRIENYSGMITREL